MALLLQMSMFLFALLLCLSNALDRLYTSLIDLSLLLALSAESCCTWSCSFYLFLCLTLFVLYWTHPFANTILCGPMFVDNTLMFLPQFYCHLFETCSTGHSILTILFNPEGGGLSNQPRLRNAISKINCICPLWLKLNVFSTYQVHGAYVHLHQSSGEDVSLAIKKASGPCLPKVWDPLHLAIPYHRFSQVLFKPPDCYLTRLATIGLLIAIYTVLLLRGAMYLTDIFVYRKPWSLPLHNYLRITILGYILTRTPLRA